MLHMSPGCSLLSLPPLMPAESKLWGSWIIIMDSQPISLRSHFPPIIYFWQIVQVILIKEKWLKSIMSSSSSISSSILPAHSEWSPICLHLPGRPDLIPWDFADLNFYYFTPHLSSVTLASLTWPEMFPAGNSPTSRLLYVLLALCEVFLSPLSMWLASSSPYFPTLFSPSHLLPCHVADALFVCLFSYLFTFITCHPPTKI